MRETLAIILLAVVAIASRIIGLVLAIVLTWAGVAWLVALLGGAVPYPWELRL